MDKCRDCGKDYKDPTVRWDGNSYSGCHNYAFHNPYKEKGLDAFEELCKYLDLNAYKKE